MGLYVRMDDRGFCISLLGRYNSWAILNQKGKIHTFMIFELKVI